MTRILFVRLSAIGDLVFASPLIAAARRALPDATLTWLVEPAGAPLLRHHPDLDAVLPWPNSRLRGLLHDRQWRRLAGEARGLVGDLRAQRFDCAIDLQGLLKSALPTRLSGAAERIGLNPREGSRLLMTRTVSLPPAGDPLHSRISSEYLHLARTLGWPVDDFRPAIHIDAETAARADALLADHGLADGYAVFCPFTTRPQKHWVEARWPALAQRVRDTWGLPVLLLGGPADRAAGARLAAGAPGVITDLTGRTGILEAAALIRRARLAVAVDTGLGHMGVAFGVPTLLLFGATLPYTETLQPAARVLYEPMPCAPCKRRPSCNRAFTCMARLTVDRVLAGIAGLPGFAR